jgi:hypothetical protein
MNRALEAPPHAEMVGGRIADAVALVTDRDGAASQHAAGVRETDTAFAFSPDRETLSLFGVLERGRYCRV